MSLSTENSTSSRSASSLYLQNTDEIKMVFARFDANGDGLISESELDAVMKALGSDTSPEEVARMMEEMDTDGDGFVNLDEFSQFCSKKVDDDTTGVKELRDAFEMYDQNKNGLISANELHLILTKLGERCSVEDCVKMIETVDSDGDGSVSFDEFKKMMSSNSSSAV